MTDSKTYGTVVRMLTTLVLAIFGTFLSGYSWVEGNLLGVVVGLCLYGFAILAVTPNKR